MDGARLSNAAASLGLPLRAFTRDAGVDVLSLGGTKNGAMLAEAIVVLDPEASEGLKFLRKLNMQLASKMRFVSAQLIALYEDDLWLRNAAHANAMAARLRAGIEAGIADGSIRGVQSGLCLDVSGWGTADGTKIQLPTKSLSVTQLLMYMKCPAMYEKRYVEGKKEPPGIALIEGSSGHDALEFQNAFQIAHGKNNQLIFGVHVGRRIKQPAKSAGGIFLEFEHQLIRAGHAFQDLL